MRFLRPVAVLAAGIVALSIGCGELLGIQSDDPPPSKGIEQKTDGSANEASTSSGSSDDGATADGSTESDVDVPDQGPVTPGSVLVGQPCKTSQDCQSGRCTMQEDPNVNVCVKQGCGITGDGFNCAASGTPCCVGYGCNTTTQSCDEIQ